MLPVTVSLLSVPNTLILAHSGQTIFTDKATSHKGQNALSQGWPRTQRLRDCKTQKVFEVLRLAFESLRL